MLLLSDYEMYVERETELMKLIETALNEIPYIDNVLAIKGIGMKTLTGFIAEVGNIRRFDDPRQIQKLAGYAVVKNESGKHKGESYKALGTDGSIRSEEVTVNTGRDQNRAAAGAEKRFRSRIGDDSRRNAQENVRRKVPLHEN